VILTTLRNGQETNEVRFFISSLGLGVKRFAKSIRNHWGIENACHWSLDVTYREDESRSRDAPAKTSHGSTGSRCRCSSNNPARPASR
jgi:predicted transposase YbfD/YdcC